MLKPVASNNPFRDPLRFDRRVPECALVIFGANGDLTKRKLLPALYRLAYERRLPDSFAIVGNSRTPMTDEAFREKMHESVKQFLEDSPFDQDLWAANYAAYDAPSALAVFTAVRNFNVILIASLPREAFEKAVSHPERGTMTFQTIVETMGGHDLNHLAQIEKIAGIR